MFKLVTVEVMGAERKFVSTNDGLILTSWVFRRRLCLLFGSGSPVYLDQSVWRMNAERCMWRNSCGLNGRSIVYIAGKLVGGREQVNEE